MKNEKPTSLPSIWYSMSEPFHSDVLALWLKNMTYETKYDFKAFFFHLLLRMPVVFHESTMSSHTVIGVLALGVGSALH